MWIGCQCDADRCLSGPQGDEVRAAALGIASQSVKCCGHGIVGLGGGCSQMPSGMLNVAEAGQFQMQRPTFVIAQRSDRCGANRRVCEVDPGRRQRHQLRRHGLGDGSPDRLACGVGRRFETARPGQVGQAERWCQCCRSEEAPCIVGKPGYPIHQHLIDPTQCSDRLGERFAAAELFWAQSIGHLIQCEWQAHRMLGEGPGHRVDRAEIARHQSQVLLVE